MKDRSETALIAVRRILRATELNSREVAKRSGLTASQYLLLQRIAREGKTTATSIAQAARLTQATVTTLIDKLERRGLVARERDTEDRRRVWLRVTEAGHDVLAKTPDTLQERFQSNFAKLEDWEQAFLVAALERAAALLGAESIDASPVLDVGDIAGRPHPEQDYPPGHQPHHDEASGD
jgi:DNA-binding MarR family transcriptional regulator